MIRKLKSVTKVPPDLETGLAEALAKRNFLAHHFFRERSDEFMSSEGRGKMIEELETAQAMFTTADEKLSDISRAVRVKWGISDERIERFLAAHRRTINSDI